MSAEPPVSKVRLPNRSAKNQMKNEQAMTFTAPKRPVSKRLRFPLLPTKSLKYCGPNTASALLPVVFWKTNSIGPTKNRRRLAGCQISRMEKLSFAAVSALSPICISWNSEVVRSPASPRIHVMDFQASSVRPLVRSQRLDSGRVKVPSNRIPDETSWRPIGICHSRDCLAISLFLATPFFLS